VSNPGCQVLLELRGEQAPAPERDGEIRLFSKCRNEQLRLPAFLRHYRELGVDGFYIADNGSSDGSLEYLRAQPDVRLFSTDGGFRKARGGTDWLNAMLARFGVGHWCVTVDVDELFVFPGSETVRLPALTRYLDDRGAEAMQCLLLDMYPGVPLNEARYSPGDDLVEAAPFFDPGPYDRFPHAECPGVRIYGGVRERVFYPESYAHDLRRKLHVALYHRLLLSLPVAKSNERVLAHKPLIPPCLTKVPLVRWDATTEYLNVNHFVSPRNLAEESGVLLHFKFLQDFHERAVREAARGEYYDGAVEFRRYSAKLRENPNMTLRYQQSTRFRDSAELVRLGLLADTPAWAEARATG